MDRRRRRGGGDDVLLDARWVGYTGIGRFVETLLEGFAEAPPPGRWAVWGGERAAGLVWPGARFVPAPHPPLSWAGQRSALAVPPAEVALWTHAIRPLRPGRTAVVVYDTIPLRHARSAARRAAFRALFTASAAEADLVLAISDATSAAVQRDLHVPARKVRRVPVPVSSALAARIRSAREGAPRTRRELLYVGQVAPHKNLPRLLAGFGASELGRSGGRLTLVGGRPQDLGQLDAARAALPPGSDVRVVPRCSDEDLVALYAAADVVVVPSLEEGFGLPAVEALDAGIPVCCSSTPALAEATAGVAVLFDPLDPGAIARGIDEAVALAADGAWDERDRRWRATERPTAADLARAAAAAVAELRR